MFFFLDGTTARIYVIKSRITVQLLTLILGHKQLLLLRLGLFLRGRGQELSTSNHSVSFIRVSNDGQGESEGGRGRKRGGGTERQKGGVVRRQQGELKEHDTNELLSASLIWLTVAVKLTFSTQEVFCFVFLSLYSGFPAPTPSF